MVNQGFSKGSKVEVRSNEEGFKGSCYVATLIETTRSNKSCVVEYEHLMESEDKDSKHLRERLNVSNIRPLPPQNKNEIIKVHDIVDAYKRDGWWKGQVKNIFDDGKQFLVYFDDTPDELIVDKHDLRLHLDWVNGNWEKPSSKKAQFYKSIREETAVEVTFESENFNIWHLGKVLEVEQHNKFLVKFRCFDLDNENPAYQTQIVESHHIRPAPQYLCLEEREYDLLHKVDVFYGFCWWSGIIQRIYKDRKYSVLLAHTNEERGCDISHLRPQLNWLDGIWTASQNNEVLPVSNFPLKTIRRSSRAKKVPTGRYCGHQGMKNNVVVCVDEANKSVNEEVGASSQTPVRKNRKKKMRDQDTEIIEGSSGNKRTPSRKRGRQPKLSLEEQIGKENLLLATVDNELDDDQFMMSCQEYMRLSRARNISQVDNKRTNEKGTSIGMEKLSIDSLSGEDAEIMLQTCAPMDEEIVVIKVQNESLSDGHGQTSKTIDVVSQNQGVITNRPVDEDLAIETVKQKPGDNETNNKINDVLRDINDGDLSDDQPLLIGSLLASDKSATSLDGDADVEKSYVVATKDIIPYSPPPKNVQDSESGEFQTPANKRCNSTDNNTNMPFDKCSPLWKYIDSMEIFSKAEWKPHFSPLLECKQETREGMAIAHMVTFSTLAEKTSKLRFSDSSSTIESYLQTLADLEKHGFDVDPVRSCLMVFLANKKMTEKLEEELKHIRNEIRNSELEKDELDTASFQMNQRIKELAEKLMVAESRKAKKNEELSVLQSRQEVIKENMRRLTDEFKKNASCPL